MPTEPDKKWSAELIEIQGSLRIVVAFPQTQDAISRFRKLNGARWSSSKKNWHLPDTSHYRTMFKIAPKTLGKAALLRISEQNQPAFDAYSRVLTLMGYSPNTKKTYLIEFSQFLYFLGEQNINTVTVQQVANYFLHCHKELGLTEASINSRYNAMKYYFVQVAKTPEKIDSLPRPKKHLQLPRVISEEKLLQTLISVENLKHRALLMLTYSAGLRVGEVVRLKISDIDSDRMMLFIHRSKGKKDRYVPLSQVALGVLRTYYIAFKPKEWLFEGQYGGQYSPRSAQVIFKEAISKLKLPKHLTFHSLRHSFATHLHESGTDIGFIQALLGHENIKTTMIYTRVAKKSIERIESPLDKLMRKAEEKGKEGSKVI